MKSEKRKAEDGRFASERPSVGRVEMKFTKEALQAVVKAKGYRWYEKYDWNLNIIGIRSEVQRADSFDDLLTVTYKIAGRWASEQWTITTDPGIPWLENPLNPQGTAILVPGQYPVYSLALHRGRYEALCQRRGPVRVYRDDNRDKVLDFDPTSIREGEFGINIHRGRVEGETPWVAKHSAGCQVFQKAKDFRRFITLCREARAIFGNRFTYTLLREEDFR